MRYHITMVKMAITKSSTNKKCWRGCGEKGTVLHCLWKCKLVQPLWRTIWRFLKKLKIEIPYNLAIPLLSIHPEKTIIQRVMEKAHSTTGQTAKARRTTVPQPVERKPHSQKDRQDEKAKGYVPDEGTK